MDIEQLTKSQIVLLTLLVSFVTSIATGIVTVSLMDQAPPVIPQTINRVVERTVERVVPEETQVATVITTEKTVVVKESDLVAQAISRVRPSVVRVHTVGNEEVESAFVARALVISPEYIVAGGTDFVPDTPYTIVSGAGDLVATLVTASASKDISLLAISQVDEAAPVAVNPASVNTTAITLGQTVVGIAGTSNVKVASGLVTDITEAENEEGTYQAAFGVDISEESLVLGSTLVNTDGAVVGMFDGDTGAVVPVQALLNLLSGSEAEEGGESEATEVEAIADPEGEEVGA